MAAAARFRGNIAGVTAVFFAIVSVPVVALVVGAIEYSNAMRTRTMLQVAADAAVLAAVSKADENKRLTDASDAQSIARAEALVRKFIEEQTRGMTDFSVDSVNIDVSMDNGKITARFCIAGRQQTPKLQIAGIENIPVKVCSDALSSPPAFVEINVLIDASGSMGIGATQRDQDIMQREIGCTFGCHISGTANAARRAGAVMRFDVVRDAAVDMVRTALTETRLQNNITFNVFTFSNTLQQIASSSDPLTVVQSKTAQAELAGAPPGGGTLFNVALADFQRTLARSGDGRTASNPKRFVMIMTDGIEDNVKFDDGGQTGWSPDRSFVRLSPSFAAGAEIIQGFNSAYCAPLKAQGATVMTLTTPYVIPRGTTDSRYLNIERILKPLIANNMSQCASAPNLAFSADDPASIQAALRRMFSATLEHARLTK
ncbi:MAG: pilus assembly protein TadG-related protein [Alphaproteobacteria bacterium]